MKEFGKVWVDWKSNSGKDTSGERSKKVDKTTKYLDQDGLDNALKEGKVIEIIIDTETKKAGAVVVEKE